MHGYVYVLQLSSDLQLYQKYDETASNHDVSTLQESA